MSKRRVEPARRARERRIAGVLFGLAIIYATVGVAGPWTAHMLGLMVPWGLYPLLLFAGLGGMMLVQRRQRLSLGSQATRTLIRSSVVLAVGLVGVLLHWIAL